MLVAAVIAALVASLLAAGGRAPATAQSPGCGAVKGGTGRLSARLDALSRRAEGRPRSAGVPVTDLPSDQGGGVRRLGDARVVVDVDVHAGRMQGAPDALRAIGDILAVSDPALHTVTMAVDAADLDRLARHDVVRNVAEVVTPVRRACGPVVSEGDGQLKAALARSTYGIDGTGVRVGILSDSFDRAPVGAATNPAADVAAGDLPGAANPCGRFTPASVLSDNAPSTTDRPNRDEGRAMAQIVHDLAPGAGLSFATAFAGETSFANNITALVNAGAKVLVDDVGYFSEPFYQDGPIAVAVNNAQAAGVAYFSAAGNANIVVGGADVGSYEATTYRPTPCPPLVVGYIDCHSFNPAGVDATSQMVLPAGSTLMLDLQWAQPRGGVITDLDICILDAGTGVVLRCGADDNPGGSGTQRPFELVGYKNESANAQALNVVVARFSGPGVRFKWVHGADDPASVEYSVSSGGDVYGPTVFGHSGAAGAISIGAVPFSNASVAEPFSSRGPVTYLFNPVPSTTPLAAPVVLAKPDVAASDCGQNSFFPPGSSPPRRFCGTSAAAPHAAAVGALLLNARGSLTPAQVASALRNTAVAVPGAPASAVGAGLIDAAGAVASLSVAPTEVSASISDASVLEGGPGTTATLAFTVTLSAASAATVTLGYATANGTATAPADYTSTSGTLAIPPGQRTATITVAVVGDAADEGDETLFVNLGSPAAVPLADGAGVGTIVDDDQPPPRNGYWLVASDGGIFAFGDARFLGSTGAVRLNRPIVAMAPTPSGNGYRLVASDGGIFAFGDATFVGSTGAIRLAQPIVGMVPTPTGRGYWLVASDGGIFAFGDARFLGSTGSIRLNRPIVAMAATPSGNGYWLVASDGGIFAFGDAAFLGSTGAIRLAQPIVGMAPTLSGRGYWLVASDGGIFAFGDARFLGSTGAIRLNRPIVGMAPTLSGNGYWLVASDGGIFAFGDARFLGSTGAIQLARPVVGIGVVRR